jgi:hypothetical protein
MTSRRTQILSLALLLVGAVSVLPAQSPSPASQPPASTAGGPRLQQEWRRYDPVLPRDHSALSTPALPSKQTIRVETWVLIVAAVVLILLLV